MTSDWELRPGSTGPQLQGLPTSGASDEDLQRLLSTLLYLGDMAAEMQAIAARSGCVTLAGLLALAQQEARVQVEAVGRSAGQG